jgi:small redox-active disulfide protein 2
VTGLRPKGRIGGKEMKIQILGTGCPKCKKTYEHAEQAVKETGVCAEIEKIQDLKAIMSFGVMVTPALAVDGEVKVAGKVPSVDEIKGYISGKI